MKDLSMDNDRKQGGFKKLFLWLTALLGGFPLNTHRSPEPVYKNGGGGGVREGLEALRGTERNLALMDEALARYLSVLADSEARSSVAGTTVLRKIHQNVRAGFVPVNVDNLPGEVAEKAVLLLEIFNEVSLACGAADLTHLLGGNDFGAGFEAISKIYFPSVNMFQPQAVRMSEGQYAEFAESAGHFEEVKAELVDLLNYYGRRA